ncbi:MAG: hypothetical protein IBJ09_13000 [Bacteroidia bacterium]|nr:hypothetical protein [Bacteroidia bacterium]
MRKFLLSAMLISAGRFLYAQADTVFIQREYVDDVYHAIYIDDHKDSKYYGYIADFTFSDWDSASYRESLVSLKGIRKRSISKTLPRQWCELRAYKGKYYLYAPSDWGNNSRLIISDTTLIEFNMDGAYASRIDSIGSPALNTWELRLTAFDNFRTKLRIHMIDAEKRLAVFESDADEYTGPGYYRLMVAADHIRNFPIIVNYCREMKQLEYEFEKIDFEQLLGRKP